MSENSEIDFINAEDRWEPKQRQSDNAQLNVREFGFMPSCQICGRDDILATRGIMSHHGYERRFGYHTASCWGARRLPYEVAKDALEEVLPELQRQLVSFQAHLTRIEKSREDVIARRTPITFSRPFVEPQGRDWEKTFYSISEADFATLPAKHPECRWTETEDQEVRNDKGRMVTTFNKVTVTFDYLLREAVARIEENAQQIRYRVRSTEIGIENTKQRIAAWKPQKRARQFCEGLGLSIPDVVQHTEGSAAAAPVADEVGKVSATKVKRSADKLSEAARKAWATRRAQGWVHPSKKGAVA